MNCNILTSFTLNLSANLSSDYSRGQFGFGGGPYKS